MHFRGAGANESAKKSSAVPINAQRAHCSVALLSSRAELRLKAHEARVPVEISLDRDSPKEASLGFIIGLVSLLSSVSLPTIVA